MVYLKNDFAYYSYDIKDKTDDIEYKTHYIENFADLTFDSIQKLQENSKKLFDTSNLEKKKLSGKYSIEKTSLPLAGLKYMISKLPEIGEFKKMEDDLSKSSGDNFFSAVTFNLLKTVKNQNVLLQNMIDYFGDSVEISSNGSNFELKFKLNIIDFSKNVFGFDLESNLNKIVTDDIKNYADKWISRNPYLNIILSGVTVDKDYNQIREDLYMFNNLKFDLDFPLISSPIAFSSFIEKNNNSKAYLSGIIASDVDSLTRKSGHSGLVFELKKTSNFMADKYLIIGVFLVIIFLIIILTLR